LSARASDIIIFSKPARVNAKKLAIGSKLVKRLWQKQVHTAWIQSVRREKRKPALKKFSAGLDGIGFV
jgi:hypothetical protein